MYDYSSDTFHQGNTRRGHRKHSSELANTNHAQLSVKHNASGGIAESVQRRTRSFVKRVIELNK